jgi:hypothetical protein
MDSEVPVCFEEERLAKSVTGDYMQVNGSEYYWILSQNLGSGRKNICDYRFAFHSMSSPQLFPFGLRLRCMLCNGGLDYLWGHGGVCQYYSVSCLASPCILCSMYIHL